MWLVWIELAGCNYILGLSTYDLPDAPTTPPPSHWASAAAGAHSTCGIRLDQTLWCWGRNDAGELGLGDTVREQDTPAQVGTATWLSVAGNEDHFCGIQADHSLWCWGRNDHGQLGIASTDDAKVPMTVVEDGPWDSVAVGYEHACAIKTPDHSMWCWGDNGQGELGDGNGGGTVMQAVPVRVVAARGWKSLAVGKYVTYGIADDSSVWGWGEAAYNALPGAKVNLVVPAMLAGTMPSSAISAYAYGACAIRAGDAKLVCWGDDTFGQVGDDNSAQSSDPTVIGTATWKSVGAGASHTCGVQSDDSLWCWGRDETDELGVTVPSFTFATDPVNVTDGRPGWSALFAGNEFTCALDGTAQLQCWGRGGEGQLTGSGSKLAPVKLAVTAEHLALGKDVTCAIDGSNVLSCWGYGDTYSLGDGGADDQELPEAHTGSWAAVALGDRGCGITTGQDLLCWGTNPLGQTGTNDAGTDHATPAMVMGTMWSSVAVGRDHGCALGPTKEVACWGWNNYGCAGKDPMATIEVDFPVIVSGTGNTSEVAVGKVHSCAIVGGSAMCWGDSDYDQLGNGNAGDSFTPVAVQGLPGNATQLVVGGFHACVQSGGPTDRWCWGDNTYGQLGDATTNDHKTAVQLLDPYTEMAAGIDHTCGIDPGGRLWCWGANDWGQLGTGDFMEHHTRQQVGADSDWAAVFAGDTHTCALKQDHSVWCWGSNRYGEIGDGTAWTLRRMIVP